MMNKLLKLSILFPLFACSSAFCQTQPESKPQIATNEHTILGTVSILALDNTHAGFGGPADRADNSIRRMSGEGFEFRYDSYIVTKTSSQVNNNGFKTRFFSMPSERTVNIGFFQALAPITISVIDSEGFCIHKETFQDGTFTFQQPIDQKIIERFYIEVSTKNGHLLDTYIFEKIE